MTLHKFRSRTVSCSEEGGARVLKSSDSARLEGDVGQGAGGQGAGQGGAPMAGRSWLYSFLKPKE